MDVNITAGSTGIGVDLSADLGEMFRARIGGTYMPHFNYVTDFGVEVGDDKELSPEKFNRLSGMLEEMTGFKVNNTIDMKGTPNFNNFRLLVDVFPFKKVNSLKNLYFTAGFYAGPKKVAKAVNTTEDMPSLMAVSIYNSMYDKVENYMYNGTYGYDKDGNEYTSLFMGVELTPGQYDQILDYGRMSMHLGTMDGYETDYWGDPVLDENGNPVQKVYKMEPDENSMVKADVIVNAFRPYLGAGFSHALDKSEKIKLGVDAGAMFWGGSPKLITHDGTDLVHDVRGIQGKTGRYVDLVKALKVFPVLNLTLSYRLY